MKTNARKSRGENRTEENKDQEPNAPRTKIKDLPRPEEELSADEQKKVQGGATRIVRSSYSSQSGDPSDEATRKTDYSS